jgi:hypothetical protein
VQSVDLEKGNGGLVPVVGGQDEEELAGGFAEVVRKGLPLLGLTMASLAVTGLTAGTATPVKSFGMLLMLLGGLTLTTVTVLRGRNK